MANVSEDIRLVPTSEEEAPKATLSGPSRGQRQTLDDVSISAYYRLAVDRIIKPHQVIALPGYWLRWWPVIKGSGLSLLLALRQVYYLKARATGEVVRTSTAEIARWAGMSVIGVKKVLKRSPFTSMVEGKAREFTVLRFPENPWLHPDDTALLHYLLGVKSKKPPVEILRAYAAKIRLHPEEAEGELEAVLGTPSPLRDDLIKTQSLYRWIVDFIPSLSGNAAVKEAAEELEKALVSRYGTIAVPWYLLRYREEIGHTLFWLYLWRRKFAPAPLSSQRELERQTGILRQTVTIAAEKAPYSFMANLFPEGILGPVAREIPLLPEDEEKARQLAVEIEEQEGQQTAPPETPRLPDAWSWEQFPKIAGAHLATLERLSITPAQFVTALAEGYANPKVIAPLGLAISLITREHYKPDPAPPPLDVYNYLKRIIDGVSHGVPSPWNMLSKKGAGRMLYDVFGEDTSNRYAAYYA